MTKKELFFTIKNWKYIIYQNFSFSQEGEDLILFHLLGGLYRKNRVFYVDIGAHHPIKWSNTMKFYLNNGSGINIDAMPGSMKAFNRVRPNDINVEAGISEEGGALEYYSFKEGAYNTFDKESADEAIEKGVILKEKIKVNTYPINTILEKYLEDGQHIDFIDIDVEGFDELIVKQLDWNKYNPDYVLIEIFHNKNNTIEEILNKNNYVCVGMTRKARIFRRKDLM